MKDDSCEENAATDQEDTADEAQEGGEEPKSDSDFAKGERRTLLPQTSN